MNMLKNRASETKTMFGGVELVAKALRVTDNTTIMRVKDVIIIKIDGATDKTVIIIITLKMRAVVEPVVGESPTFKLMDWAKAESAKQKIPKSKIIAIKLIFFIMILPFVILFLCRNIVFNNLRRRTNQ